VVLAVQLGPPPLPPLGAAVSPPDDEPPDALSAPVPTWSLEQAEAASTPRVVKPAHFFPVQAIGA